MEHKSKLYIAYGSNLNLEQMARRCPTAKVTGTAELKNYELLFRGAERGGRGAVATVEPKEGAKVPILLWKIGAKDERALDRYEGYPTLYHKQEVPVDLAGKELSAMVYVMNPRFELGVPSSFYYETIAEGYRSAGFDIGVLDAAVEESYNRSLYEAQERQQSLFESQEEKSDFASQMEAMVENATLEKTAEWEQFVRNAAEAYGPGETNLRLYCDELLTEMQNILDKYGGKIVSQIYSTGGMEHTDMLGAAEYLAEGGDPTQLLDLADNDQFMHL